MVSEINKNFLIRYQFDSSNQTYLIGAGQYYLLVGQELAYKHFQRVLENGLQVYTFKLRRGLKINFISK